MAEVLSPSIQSSAPISMMRPSSADAFQGASSQYSQASARTMPARGAYAGATTGYRGAAAGPIPTFAFSSTPGLRQDSRPSSTPSPSQNAMSVPRHTHTQSASASSTASTESSQPSAKDDSVIGSHNGSLINLSSSIPDLALTSPFEQSPAKPSPDRYRRPAQKRTDSNNSTKAATTQAGPSQVNTGVKPSNATPASSHTESVDDLALNASKPNRYRRRSLNNLETQTLTSQLAARPSTGDGPSATSTPTTIRPVPFEAEGGSNGSSTGQSLSATASQEVAKSGNIVPVQAKVVSVPPRGSSDTTKRVNAPSPLSQQARVDEATTSTTSPPKKTYASAAQAGMNSSSPATQHLAKLADKDLNKGMKSRLRRAFSFGSAQELRRGATENNAATQQGKEPAQTIEDELDAEQQEIARRQEEAGFGVGIYSGQGGFTGSTDNLSISSTASSASMMLRKMGQSAKKSARSIKGLFRPKSVIGVPAADGPVQIAPNAAVLPSTAAVSMVTVEAERQKVNVNADPTERPHGGTGFPKLERNSIDTAIGLIKPSSRGSAEGSVSRTSFVGSDKDRAEALAQVKGILKRTGTASPAGSPVIKPVDGASAPLIQVAESPASSMPSTPKDIRAGSLKSASKTDLQRPGMNGAVRSISFSSRIQFHDAWSSNDYDRRGEIATCNRLTPMLAQQIKEELNTFKMASLN